MSLVSYAVDSEEEEQESSDDEIIANTNNNKPLVFARLPPPKQETQQKIVTEENDEFLARTAKTTHTKVKISVPALNAYNDVDMKYRDKCNSEQPADASKRLPSVDKNKSSKLLSLLPCAKSEQNFLKAKPASVIGPTMPNNSFVPDSVRLGRAARNTEDLGEAVTRCQLGPKKVETAKHESSEDEAADEDFFSLNKMDDTNEVEPVSLDDIKLRVAKRPAGMFPAANGPNKQKQESTQPATSHNVNQLDAQVIQSLAGRTAAKRAKYEKQAMEVVDIKSSDILPDRSEWMRTALASSTSYQATGVLTDEEPAAGTRRKHQITYLAHKAKANEAELQAMWAANRQTRRATASKYGF